MILSSHKGGQCSGSDSKYTVQPLIAVMVSQCTALPKPTPFKVRPYLKHHIDSMVIHEWGFLKKYPCNQREINLLAQLHYKRRHGNVF